MTLKDFLNSIEIIESNILLLVCSIILLFGIIYLYINYLLLNRRLNQLIDYTSNVNTLGKIYSNSEFDSSIFKKLLFDSLKSLKKNINLITQPYFYSKNINQILRIYPDYILTMKFTKYTFDHPDTKTDAVHKILTEKYGPNYIKSPDISINVTTDFSKFRESSYDHSLLIDLTKAQVIYKKYMSTVNTILSKNM
jgi:hypothetical protein